MVILTNITVYGLRYNHIYYCFKNNNIFGFTFYITITLSLYKKKFLFLYFYSFQEFIKNLEILCHFVLKLFQRAFFIIVVTFFFKNWEITFSNTKALNIYFISTNFVNLNSISFILNVKGFIFLLYYNIHLKIWIYPCLLLIYINNVRIIIFSYCEKKWL